ncbi:response regulator [Cohnella sp. GCM10012308]|uniref:response regulator transcription factor n=1 Tax=Cohnella sp. GCM10012308 TaxID=3317329 RepID=UPI00360A79DC
MTTLMLVDDEPIAIDYLADLIGEQTDVEAEVMKAYSGAEACRRMEDVRIDVLVTDIRMPGMSGIELAERVRERWPRCRVVFLTGHGDFGYAQTAIRQGGTDYVLKTEGDETIFAAIRKALRDLAQEIDREAILSRARGQLQEALPVLRRDYLLQLAEGSAGSADAEDARTRRFEELAIPLDAAGSVTLAFGRIDDWGPFASASAKALLPFAIHNIAEEYLSPSLRVVTLSVSRDRFLWLAQARSQTGQQAADERTPRTLASEAEHVQQSCARLLKASISLAVASRPVPWTELPDRLERLKLQLAGRVGNAAQMLMLAQDEEEPVHSRTSRDYSAENELRAELRKLDLLESYLDNGEKEATVKLFKSLTDAAASLTGGARGERIRCELFAQLSAFLLGYANKRQLSAPAGEPFPTDLVANLGAHPDTVSGIRYLSKIGESLAEYNGKKQMERASDLIGILHGYIHEFIGEELSLTRLSGIVHLSSFYLSRVYKQMTGQGLLEYITEVRIQRAKLLLKTTDLKVHEIAALIGLESPAYFTRLFKKETSSTPQEYRES